MTWWVQWQHRAQGLFVLDGRQGLMSLSPQPSKGRSTLTCSPRAGATDAQAMAGPGCLWREVPQLCLFLWISRWTVVKLPQAFSFFSIPSVIRSSDIYQMLLWNCLCSSRCTCKVWISSSLWFCLGWQRYMDSWYTMGKVQWQSHAPKLCLYEMNTSPNLGPSWRKCQLKRVLVGE